jgi:hypothetical protein
MHGLFWMKGGAMKILSAIFLTACLALLGGCAALDINMEDRDQVDLTYGYTDKFEGMSYDRSMPYAPYHHPSP